MGLDTLPTTPMPRFARRPDGRSRPACMVGVWATGAIGTRRAVPGLCQDGNPNATHPPWCCAQAARRSYRWCKPPTSGNSITSPVSGAITPRGFDASLQRDKCVREL